MKKKSDKKQLQDRVTLYPYCGVVHHNSQELQLEKTNPRFNEALKAAQMGQWHYNTREDIISFSGHTGVLSNEHVQRLTLNEFFRVVVPEDRIALRDWLDDNEYSDKNEGLGYRTFVNNQIYYMRLKTYSRKQEADGSYSLEGYVQNVSDIQRHRNDINILAHAVNNAQESISATLEDGTIIFANQTFRTNHRIPENADITQYKIYELVGGGINTLQDWVDLYKNIDVNGRTTFTVYNPVKYNKDILALEGVIHHITSDEGQVSYWTFTHDITERLRRESTIKRLNNLLDAIINNLPAGVMVKEIENDFRHIFRNPESYNRFDFSGQGSAIGKTDFDLLDFEKAQLIRKHDMEIAKTGNPFCCIYEGKDANGKRIILDERKMKIESEGFSPLILSLEWDITELEEMKHQLEIAKEKAETSDKLKSAFLANMSHEIRTPLNAIVGFSRIITECDDVEQRRQYCNIVESNNERLLKLINEILDLSKVESGITEFNIGRTNLNGLCNEIFDIQMFHCPATIKLVYEPSDENIFIQTDKNRLFQVVSNLIENAKKFTPVGTISYGYRQKGDSVLFHVADTGAGIANDQLDKVFDRFVKGYGTIQGTGLGLSICKSLVERLGGSIWVTSELGNGTTFYFTLPATDTCNQENIISAAENSLSGEQESEPMRDLCHKSPEDVLILIAEDTDSSYELLEAAIGKRYKLQRALDGIEAVTLFDQLKPDLVLMDIKMPNLDGLDATRIIRQLSPDIPIIAQSAYAYVHDRELARQAGCNDFIAKPILFNKLNEMLDRWLYG